MPRYVIDSYAWVEYFIASDKGERIKKIVESNNEINETYTSVISVAEITSITKRENRDVEQAYNNIISLSKIYGINEEFAKEAGILHAEIRKEIKDFGMADAMVLLTSRKLNAKILTGDPHFKGFKEAMLI